MIQKNEYMYIQVVLTNNNKITLDKNPIKIKYIHTHRICNFNRHYAEPSGYWKRSSTFLSDMNDKVKEGKQTMTFYDSNTGKPLFVAPKGRSLQEFLDESTSHGWPSFRDSEVVWENVRCLPDGETVSVDGTHLGHNLPDFSGNRYCINLVSVAGRPDTTSLN